MLTALLLHVSLAFPSTPALSSDMLRTAVAEAAGVWSPYGVAIGVAAPFDCRQGRPCGWASDDSTVLTVVAVETRRTLSSRAPAGWRGVLGAIAFEPNGTPSPVITVFLADLERFITHTRVLGRVLAHEIGHFVLRMRGHATVGLMRPVQSARDMVGPSRRGFALSRNEARRLQGAQR